MREYYGMKKGLEIGVQVWDWIKKINLFVDSQSRSRREDRSMGRNMVVYMMEGERDGGVGENKF